MLVVYTSKRDGNGLQEMGRIRLKEKILSQLFHFISLYISNYKSFFDR